MVLWLASLRLELLSPAAALAQVESLSKTLRSLQGTERECSVLWEVLIYAVA